jgi:hypothetical protein
MPLETIRIRVPTLPFPEPGTTFLSRLAYPKANDSSQENQFWAAVCQWAILARSERDRDWGLKPQPIRPIIFMGRKIDRKAIRHGETRLHRLFTAAFMVNPVIIKHLTGELYRKYGWSARKMKDLRRDAMRSENWEAGSKTTFSSGIWSPFKPVVHAASAYLLVTREPLIWPPRVDAFFDCLASPELLRRIVILSEAIRQRPALLEELKIKEGDTVQFLPDLIS